MNSLDIHSLTFGMTGAGKSKIIVAGVDGVIIGRRGGPPTYTSFAVTGNTKTFYFGTYDMGETLNVALPITTYPFTVNAGGSYTRVNAYLGSGTNLGNRNQALLRVDLPTTAGNYMISGGITTAANVHISGEVTVFNGPNDPYIAPPDPIPPVAVVNWLY
jgi:hypothetical protein